MVRRMYVVANHVVSEQSIENGSNFEQLDMFTDYEILEKQRKQEAESLKRERSMQKAMLEIKKKYGKSAILKGDEFSGGRYHKRA